MLSSIRNRILSFVILPFTLLSCSSDGIRVNLILASNTTENPLITISQNMQLGTATGLFFVFDELESDPQTINDTIAGGDTYTDPSGNGSAGYDPLSKDFKISTDSLKPNAYYRLRVVSRNSGGAVVYVGNSDCPINLSFKGANNVKVCFGENIQNSPPICPGMTAFDDCPGFASNNSAGQVQ